MARVSESAPAINQTARLMVHSQFTGVALNLHRSRAHGFFHIRDGHGSRGSRQPSTYCPVGESAFLMAEELGFQERLGNRRAVHFYQWPFCGSWTYVLKDWTTVLTAQIVMVSVALLAGCFCDSWGRKPVMAIAFRVLPVRIASYTLAGRPSTLVYLQCPDGIGAGIYGVAVVSGLRFACSRFVPETNPVEQR